MVVLHSVPRLPISTKPNHEQIDDNDLITIQLPDRLLDQHLTNRSGKARQNHQHSLHHQYCRRFLWYHPRPNLSSAAPIPAKFCHHYEVSKNTDVEREDLNKSNVVLSLNLNEDEGDGDGGGDDEQG
ncbi:unnamed protein product [Lactuca virosa]|uniref:Uncharacterized protein n=1 Tax=Lactuca virosa TaxID=75947 RepID=A0AAU9PMP4_9ASTR|nr:unnamed protein product [Lactuca virosa]